MPKPSLLSLFWGFFRVGALTFGGGYSMMPMLQAECVEKRKWVSSEKIVDFFTTSNCLPGIIAANTAAMTGCYLRGWKGGVFAASGVIAPSIAIMFLIVGVLHFFIDNVYVQHAFTGINIAVVALIAQAVIKLWKGGIKSVPAAAICVLAFGLTAIPLIAPIPFSASPIAVILCAAAVGVTAGLVKARKFPQSRGGQ
jgi:chromate transporter